MAARAIRQGGAGGLSWTVFVVAVVVAVVAAGVAKIAGAPGWLVVLTAAVGAAVFPVVGAVRTQLEQQRESRAEVRRVTAGAAEPTGLVRDQSALDLRVHRSVREDVPYIERDVEETVASRLQIERRVLIVGPSMSGKTRLALSAAKAAVADYVLFEPRNEKSIGEALAAGTKFRKVLVWLDDLERYVGSGGLSVADLNTRHRNGGGGGDRTGQRVRQASAGR